MLRIDDMGWIINMLLRIKIKHDEMQYDEIIYV